MAESDLYIPVRDWLTARGYEVHVELFGADVIALKDGRVTVVELKSCLSWELIRQLTARAAWADYCYAAVPTDPRDTKVLRHSGFGLLQVVNGLVRQRIQAKPQPWAWHKMRAYRLKRLFGRVPALPTELAGLPASTALRRQRDERRLLTRTLNNPENSQ